MQTNVRVKGNFSTLYAESYSHTPSLLAMSNFFYLQSVGHFRAHKDYLTRREGYQSFLVLYTVSGKGYLYYRGKRYELTCGDVFFIDCLDFQEYYTDQSELWELKWFHFNGLNSAGYFKLIYERLGPVIRIGRESRLPLFIDELMMLLKSRERQLEIKASCIIMQILTELLLVESEKTKGESRTVYYKHDQQIEAVIDFIRNNFQKEINLSDLAAAACSSKYHLIRTFKRATGYSPYEYLIKYRINRAKDLLSTTFNSVEEVAEAVGFKSTSNFINTFHACSVKDFF